MTVVEFQAAFPAFKDVVATTIQRQLTNAARYLEKDDWGDYYDDGLGNFVAHNLALDPSVGGAINSSSTDIIEKRVGAVTVVRSARLMEAQTRNPFLRTIYGQMYLYYRSLAGVGTGAVAV